RGGKSPIRLRDRRSIPGGGAAARRRPTRAGAGLHHPAGRSGGARSGAGAAAWTYAGAPVGRGGRGAGGAAGGGGGVRSPGTPSTVAGGAGAGPDGSAGRHAPRTTDAAVPGTAAAPRLSLTRRRGKPTPEVDSVGPASWSSR